MSTEINITKICGFVVRIRFDRPFANELQINSFAFHFQCSLIIRFACDVFQRQRTIYVVYLYLQISVDLCNNKLNLYIKFFARRYFALIFDTWVSQKFLLNRWTKQTRLYRLPYQNFLKRTTVFSIKPARYYHLSEIVQAIRNVKQICLLNRMLYCCDTYNILNSVRHHFVADFKHNLELKNWRIKNQLDATYYFIVLLIDLTYFGRYYVHHQELATMMLLTTLVVSFLVFCRLEVRCV